MKKPIFNQEKYKFIGKNGSLGYKSGTVYEIQVIQTGLTGPVAICRLDGSGECTYSSFETFLQNWSHLNKDYNDSSLAEGMTLQQIIEEGEKEFNDNFPFLNEIQYKPFYEESFKEIRFLTEIQFILGDKIKYWHKVQQHKLLAEVIKMVDAELSKDFNVNESLYDIGQAVEYGKNQALSDLKSKLQSELDTPLVTNNK